MELKKGKFLKHLLRTMTLSVFYWISSRRDMYKIKRMKVVICLKVVNLEPWSSKAIKDCQLILKQVG